MEEHPVKLELIAPAMNEFIAKLQSFDTLSTAEQRTSALRNILTVIEDVRNSLKKSSAETDARTQSFYDSQIDRIFNEFNWNINYTMKPNEHGKVISCCKTLAASIMRMLGRRNCGILVVEMYFKMCIKLINELSDGIQENSNVLKDLLLFQLLVKGFVSCVQVLKRFWYVIVLPEQKCSIMLCLNQSFKTLCFLGKVIDKRMTHLILYLLNRLKQCFQKMLSLLFNNGIDPQNSEFIVLMDSCLNKLDHLAYDITLQEDSNDNDNDQVTKLKPLLDELLCHAMTVSHISDGENGCELIKSYSQKILDEYRSMEEGKDNEELGSKADRLSVLLCQLEESVNVAVLNVVLDVFTDVNDPLRNLVNKCNEQPEASGDRSGNDLEEEISAFDEHMDKIMHIGLFAVSCSTDVKKILGIRSCMASLESLEAELITSIISLYLHSNGEVKTTFRYIFRNWLEEVNELKNLMDLVLDPSAFSKVVEKRIASILCDIKNDDCISLSKIRTALNKILAYSKKLIKTLTRSVEHDDEEEVSKKMEKFIENLRIAYQECEASLTLLIEETPIKEVLDRVVKRIVLIIRAIANIIRGINNVNNISENDSNVYEEFTSIRIINNEGKLDIYNINAITPEPNPIPNSEILTPYIIRGKERTKERTILYQTPKNPQNFQSITKNPEFKHRSWMEEGTPRRSRARYCRPLPKSLELENSLDLELTNLLDNVSELSNTFRTINGDSKVENDEEDLKREVTTPKLPEENPDEKVFLGTLLRRKLDQSLNELSNSSSLSIHKDSNCRYETPERLHDLTLVQQKINFLMENMTE